MLGAGEVSVHSTCDKWGHCSVRTLTIGAHSPEESPTFSTSLPLLTAAREITDNFYIFLVNPLHDIPLYLKSNSEFLTQLSESATAV